MELFVNPNLAWTMFLVVVLVVITIAGIHIVRRFRGRDEEDQPMASEMMTNFRELHSRGDLSDAEYRTIKTVLATKLREQINDTGEKG